MASAPQPTSLRMMRIVWGALLYSTCVYAFVLLKLSGGEWATMDPPPESDLPTILASLGLVIAPLVLALRKALLGAVALAAPDSINETRVADDAELNGALVVAMRQYQTGLIAGLAAAESIVVLGMVGAWLARDPTLFFPGWGLGALLMAMQFPRWHGVAHLLTPPQRAALYAREGLSLRA